MPNGRPGDHPLTDILHYGWDVFGEPVDGLVKELAAHPNFQAVSDEIADLLLDATPVGAKGGRETVVPALTAQLEAVKARLEATE